MSAWGRRVKHTFLLRLLAGVSLSLLLGVSSVGLFSSGSAPVLADAAPAIKVSGNELVTGTGQPIRLIGIDVTGTEDACILDDGFSWGSGNPSSAEAAAIASWHADAVRVPLNEDCWLGINGAPAAYSGAAYQQRIEQWISEINSYGMVAILDLHWAAPSTYQANEEWPMADADHALTFWNQVASTFKSNPSVIFQPFNEPFIGTEHPDAADWSCWLNGCSTTFAQNGVTYQTAGMQQMVDTIRATGATQPILVSGLNWSGEPCGTGDSDYNGTCMMLADLPHDPLNQLIVSMHTYYKKSACFSTACYQIDALPIIKKLPLIFDEFGEKDCTSSFDTALMDWADQYNLSYLAWTWQANVNNETCAEDSGVNQRLNLDWNGDVNNLAPAPPVIRAHYLSDDWYYGSPPSVTPPPPPTATTPPPAATHTSSSGSGGSVSAVTKVLTAPFNAVNTAVAAASGSLSSIQSSSSKSAPTSFWGTLKYMLTNNSFYRNSLARRISEGVITAILLAAIIYFAVVIVLWSMRLLSHRAMKRAVTTGKYIHGKVGQIIRPGPPGPTS